MTPKQSLTYFLAIHATSTSSRYSCVETEAAAAAKATAAGQNAPGWIEEETNYVH